MLHISKKDTRWRWVRPQSRTLGLIAVDERETDLIRHTLGVLQTEHEWALGEPENADALLVDVDSPAGRSRWWALRHAQPRRPVIALTVDADLHSLDPVVHRPIRGDALRAALEKLERSADPRRAANGRRTLVAELVARCPYEEFRVYWPDGTWYIFDRPADRLIMSDYNLDSFTDRLFSPLGAGRLKALQSHVNGSSGGVSRRLSRRLTEAALDHPAPETLPWFDNQPRILRTDMFAPNRLPLSHTQQRIVKFLEQQDDVEMLELVVAGGVATQGACGVVTALYLNGMVSFE